jgi:ADP-dependent NAD(P)H-hydrate dehydratase / NAD(P)H-hydrate epimerase
MNGKQDAARSSLKTKIMQKILSAEEMREIDRQTTEKYGIPSILLMENAAHAVANVIKKKLGGSVAGKSFLILCGKGNNGGDGAALARILINDGAEVHCYLFGKFADTKGDAGINVEILRRLTERSEEFCPTFWEEANDKNSEEFVSDIESTENFDILIDALFGTGLKRPIDLHLSEWFKLYLQFLTYKKKYPFVVSIDIPSGLNADSEQVIGYNFQADLTITFTAPKLANVLPPASDFNGELVVANIGSPQELIDNSPSNTFLAEKSDVLNWLEQTKFTSSSYKNKRGHALLIVGSKEYTGAAVLAGNAAMLSGVGLTTIATSESAQTAISAKVLEEIIVRGLPENKDGAIDVKAFTEIEKLTEKIDVTGIGCGLGITGGNATTRKRAKTDQTSNLVYQIIENRKTPIVIDADGLNALSPFDLQGSDELPLILTPHEGEFLRLLGMKDKEILKDRIKAVRDFAEKHKVILVLKGERTLIAAPDGKVVINPTGNSGLGKAGNGDTLTGIITGFIAQTLTAQKDLSFYTPSAEPKIFEVFDAVVAAVYIAGLAGDIAEWRFGKRTMLASDVRMCLGEAFQMERGHPCPPQA